MPSELELSLLLQSTLTKAGFVKARAALQAAVADALQGILRSRRDSFPGIYIVGSYSEGWGNSLTKADGRTDAESDIDVMKLFQGRLYHIRGSCQCCDRKEKELVDCKDGHIRIGGFATNPAKASSGTPLRPAVDEVDACRVCCYPPIAPLLPHRISSSNISPSVLNTLQGELSKSPCHVVHAAPPRQAGKQLRVSTTFLEKLLLRGLSTLQGQLFVTLKYLVK
uniref:NTP_transf_2 domain-containing protein n=1 Tax=Macrostomum lignano TaxID=282301 RepID=A0A1I8GSR7_9PLAT